MMKGAAMAADLPPVCDPANSWFLRPQGDPAHRAFGCVVADFQDAVIEVGTQVCLNGHIDISRTDGFGTWCDACDRMVSIRPESRARASNDQAERRAKELQASPPWLTKAHRTTIRALYQEAASLTRETGIRHHVDHVIPLVHSDVCGLHVPWNCQVLTAEDNLQKHNKFDGTMDNKGWRDLRKWDRAPQAHLSRIIGSQLPTCYRAVVERLIKMSEVLTLGPFGVLRACPRFVRGLHCDSTWREDGEVT